MSEWPGDFEKYVLEDIKSNKDKRKIRKACLIERYMHRYCSPLRIHANPTDDFTHEDVGPNFTIVNDYIAEIKRAQKYELDIFSEPVMVEKLDHEGYMLLNGHHRWFAALRMKVSRLHIQIVNLIHEKDVSHMLEKTGNIRRASFDLDEVLLTSDSMDQAEIINSLFAGRIKERLRRGAPDIIRALQNMGYDVWVYTAGYLSEEYITSLFSMYNLKIEGVVNGMDEKRRADMEETKQIRKMMTSKYMRNLHIDNESVLFVNSSDASYEQYDIFRNSDEWANGILSVLDSMN